MQDIGRMRKGVANLPNILQIIVDISGDYVEGVENHDLLEKLPSARIGSKSSSYIFLGIGSIASLRHRSSWVSKIAATAIATPECVLRQKLFDYQDAKMFLRPRHKSLP